MIFSGSVVCLEWSDSKELGLNNYPNHRIKSIHETSQAHPLSKAEEQHKQIAL